MPKNTASSSLASWFRIYPMLPAMVLAFVGLGAFMIVQSSNSQTSDQSLEPAVSNKTKAPTVTILTNVLLIDGTGKEPLKNATLVIEDGKIAAAGKVDVKQWADRAGASIIDAKGKTVIPGLISNHSHIGLVAGGVFGDTNFTRQNIIDSLRTYEAYGITAVMSLGMNRDLLYQIRDDQREGKFGGASVYSAGKGIGIPDGAPPINLPPTNLVRVATPEEGRDAVRKLAADKADMVKLWTDALFGRLKRMPVDVASAIVEEAHSNNLRVAAHVYSLQDGKDLLNSGLDIIGHSVRDIEVDAEFIEQLKKPASPESKQRRAYIPTLSLDETLFVYADQPEWMQSDAFRKVADPKLLSQWNSAEYAKEIKENPLTEKHRAGFAMAKKNLKALFDAGVLIGFGTDSGANPNRLSGWMEHRELQLYVEAGLTPMQAIVCATRNAAEILNELDQRGTLEKGKRADFILLSANPLEDISNTLAMEAIYHGGELIQPAL